MKLPGFPISLCGDKNACRTGVHLQSDFGHEERTGRELHACDPNTWEAWEGARGLDQLALHSETHLRKRKNKDWVEGVAHEVRTFGRQAWEPKFKFPVLM